jgi:hypothetical protein
VTKTEFLAAWNGLSFFDQALVRLVMERLSPAAKLTRRKRKRTIPRTHAEDADG